MRRWISIALVSFAMAASAEAHADGVLLGGSALSAKDHASLVNEVAKAKSSTPQAFTTLAQIRAALPRLDADKRGRMASITPSLRAMGKPALMPMLQELALDADGRGTLTDSAWRAWRVALLEAVGSLRDARSRPVLVAALESNERDFAVLRAAANALGRESSDAATSKLLALESSFKGDKRRAVWSGLGNCRRTLAAERLAAVLPGASARKDLEILTRALGDVGSAWAWETPAVSKSGEQAAVRGAAAQALIEGYAAHFASQEIGELFTRAVLVVDHPDTKALIAAAKSGADARLAAALDALAQRFDDSPLH